VAIFVDMKAQSIDGWCSCTWRDTRLART